MPRFLSRPLPWPAFLVLVVGALWLGALTASLVAGARP